MTDLRSDFAIIVAHIPQGARVLDIGCGDGELMAALRSEKGADVRGLELDPGKVATAMSRGLPVVQGDAASDLADYASGSFDFAVLSHALQTMARPDGILQELLRIGRRAFVSFPNFAHWRVRSNLLFRGRMPINRMLPDAWYDTGNIHHATIADFRRLAEQRGIAIEHEWYLSAGRERSPSAANLLAEQAVFLLRAKD